MVDAHKWVSNKVGDLEKNLGLYILKNNFFQVLTQKNNPSLQNHFSATLKITFNFADWKRKKSV